MLPVETWERNCLDELAMVYVCEEEEAPNDATWGPTRPSCAPRVARANAECSRHHAHRELAGHATQASGLSFVEGMTWACV